MSKRSKANEGRSGAVRQKALKAVDLANMERHGKREDENGQRRQVREAAPLVFGSLDVRDACAAHLDGVQRTRGAKTECLHALIQYPTKLIDAADDEKQQWMLDHAVAFVNRFHGGDAVFAARLDRDEKGQHSVDVFAMPRYDYAYRDGSTVKKASVSRFSKQHAKARFNKTVKTTDEKTGKTTEKEVPRDDRRAQGSALQDAWFEYMRDEMKLEGVQKPERKKVTTADRVEPEIYGLRKDKQAYEKKKLLDRNFSIKTNEILLEKSDKIKADRMELDAERAAFEAEKKLAAPALEAARMQAEGSGQSDRAMALSVLQKGLQSQPGKVSRRRQRDEER
jgi:hypothetical protein